MTAKLTVRASSDVTLRRFEEFVSVLNNPNLLRYRTPSGAVRVQPLSSARTVTAFPPVETFPPEVQYCASAKDQMCSDERDHEDPEYRESDQYRRPVRDQQHSAQH